MLLVKSSFPVLLSLGLVSQLYAQGPGDWWLQDNDAESDAERAQNWGVPVPDEEWLRDNDVEPFPPRPADGRFALKTLVKALFRFKHLKASESATKGKGAHEHTKTSTEYVLLAVPGTKTTADSLPAPSAHHHMMEDDKSHRFTHSIRFGYGAPDHGSLL